MNELPARLAAVWWEGLSAASLQAGVLVVAALGVSLLYRRAGPGARHLLWLIVLCRLLLPIGISTPIGLLPGSPDGSVGESPMPVSAFAADPTPVSEAAASGGSEPAAIDPAPRPPTFRLDWKATALLLWAAGILAYLSAIGLRLARVRAALQHSPEPATELLDRVGARRRQLGIKRSVRVRTASLRSRLPCPAVMGWGRCTLILPEELLGPSTRQELDAVILHELIHVRRRDDWINAVQSAVQVVYFFHPLVWLANRKLRLEREQTCDDQVVATSGDGGRRYLTALVRCAALRSGRGVDGDLLPALANRRSHLAARVARLASAVSPTGSGGRAVAVHAALLAVLCVALAARGSLTGTGLTSPAWPSAGQRDVAGPTTTPEAVERQRLMALADAGTRLSPLDAERIAKRLERRPDDLDARIQLLAFLRHQDGSCEPERWAPHVLWLIEKRPRVIAQVPHLVAVDRDLHPDLFRRVAAAWSRQVARHPGDAAVLAAAADHLYSEPKLARRYARLGRALEPERAAWPLILGTSWRFESYDAPAGERRPLQERALTRYEEAYSLGADWGERLTAAVQAAKVALELGDEATSERYAAALMALAATAPTERLAAMPLHQANIVRGRIALRQGAVESAGRSLLAAARLPATASLAFGPSMALAHELLGKGERDVVRLYLERIGRFWPRGTDRLATWRAAISRHEAPDFEPNLGY